MNVEAVQQILDETPGGRGSDRASGASEGDGFERELSNRLDAPRAPKRESTRERDSGPERERTAAEVSGDAGATRDASRPRDAEAAARSQPGSRADASSRGGANARAERSRVAESDAARSDAAARGPLAEGAERTARDGARGLDARGRDATLAELAGTTRATPATGRTEPAPTAAAASMPTSGDARATAGGPARAAGSLVDALRSPSLQADPTAASEIRDPARAAAADAQLAQPAPGEPTRARSLADFIEQNPAGPRRDGPGIASASSRSSELARAVDDVLRGPAAGDSASQGGADAQTGDGSLDAQTARALARLSGSPASGAGHPGFALAPTDGTETTTLAPPAAVAEATPGVPVGSPELRVPASAAPEVLAMQVERLAEQGGGRARLRLNPPNLGELSLQVTVRGNSVDVSVVAREAAAQMIVEGGRDQLSDALASRDLRMEGFDVSHRSPNEEARQEARARADEFADGSGGDAGGDSDASGAATASASGWRATPSTGSARADRSHRRWRSPMPQVVAADAVAWTSGSSDGAAAAARSRACFPNRSPDSRPTKRWPPLRRRARPPSARTTSSRC